MNKKYMKSFNGEKIFSLEYDKETLRDMIIDLQKEIERLKEDYAKEKYLVDKLTRQLTDEYKNTEYQCEEKERLNNIIKEADKKIYEYNNIIREVREYIENNKQYAELEDYGKNGEYYIDEIGLLEILDKGE